MNTHNNVPSNLRLTRRGVAALTAVTAAASAGMVYAAAGNGTPSPKPEKSTVLCELPVEGSGATSTLSGLADSFEVGQKDIKVYHPGSTTAEKNPVYEMQPGDTAAARIGATACYGAGGMPGDPEHPNVIIE